MKRFLIMLCMLAGVLLSARTLPAAAAPPPAAVYAVNSAAYTYHAVPEADYQKIEKALDLPAGKAELDGNAENLGGFCVFYTGGKTLYTITETQVLKGETPLAASGAQRKKLLELCGGYWSLPGVPELLGYMSPEKVTEVEYSCLAPGVKDDGSPVTAELRYRQCDAPAEADTFIKIMKSLAVTRGKPVKMLPHNSSGGLMEGSILFETGVRYRMYLSDSSLEISSSDGGAYRYDFADNGMPYPRGWYLRSEMLELVRPYDTLSEAVILYKLGGGIKAAKLSERAQLCALAAFENRFCQPLPTGIKSPIAGGGESVPDTPETVMREGWLVLFLKAKEGGDYRRIVLWGDEHGGRFHDETGRGIWDPLLPGDSAYIVSLMEAGEPLSRTDALPFLQTPI